MQKIKRHLAFEILSLILHFDDNDFHSGCEKVFQLTHPCHSTGIRINPYTLKLT